MTRFAVSALVLALLTPAIATDIPSMILARKPVSVSQSSSGFLVTYPDGRIENWWSDSSEGYRVNGVAFHKTPSGYRGPNGELYRKTSYGWARSGTTNIQIRANGFGGYQVDNARYSPAGAGCRLTSPEPRTQRIGRTNMNTRTKSPGK